MKLITLKPHANGEIHLKDTSIEVNDKSGRMPKKLFKILPLVFLFIGLYQIYVGSYAHEELQMFLRLISGVLLLLIPAALYHSNFKRSNKKEITLNDIEAVIMKKLFGVIFIDIQLIDGSTRRIYNIKHIDDWKIIKNHLTERNVTCLN